MGYSFDGTTKIIQLTSGTVYVSVRDMYSRWKDWALSTGSKFLQAFSVVGGEPVDESQGIYVTSYFFLTNGWKIKPQEVNHKLTIADGVLVTSDGSGPFVQTSGAYNVLVQYSQPVKSETVDIGGGGGASAADVWSYGSRVLTSDGNESIANVVMSGSLGITVDLISKILKNKMVTDPQTGIVTIYNDDGSVLLQANLYENVAGTQRYRGQGADRRDQFS